MPPPEQGDETERRQLRLTAFLISAETEFQDR